MKQRLLSAALLGTLLATAGLARAQAPGADDENPPPPPPPATTFQPPPPPPVVDDGPRTHRYGWQILAVDAAAVVASATTNSPEVLVGAWTLGAPIVHVAHGRPDKAVLSFALHAGLPLAGAYAGAAAADCDDSEELFCGLGEVVVGMALGGLAATAIDAGLLAVETEERRRPAEAPLRYRGVQASPTVAASHNGLSLGLNGSF